jgi:hypothetical protein
MNRDGAKTGFGPHTPELQSVTRDVAVSRIIRLLTRKASHRRSAERRHGHRGGQKLIQMSKNPAGTMDLHRSGPIHGAYVGIARVRNQRKKIDDDWVGPGEEAPGRRTSHRETCERREREILSREKAQAGIQQEGQQKETVWEKTIFKGANGGNGGENVSCGWSSAMPDFPGRLLSMLLLKRESEPFGEGAKRHTRGAYAPLNPAPNIRKPRNRGFIGRMRRRLRAMAKSACRKAEAGVGM